MTDAQAAERADCERCVHFRQAPWQAAKTGCYHAPNMPVHQKAAFLDQQQQPGDHRTLNRAGDCPDFRARAERPSLWQRLLGA